MKIRFCIKICLALYIILCMLPAAIGSQPIASPNKVVKAGIFPFEGYHMRDEEDTLSGYGIDVLNLLSKYSHLNFEFKGLDQPWGEMTKMLENGDIDIVTSARRTPEREEKFLFSQPIGRSNTILSISLDNKIQKPGQYNTYNDMLVGMLKGSSQNDKLKSYAEKRGFTYRPVEFDTTEDLISALHKGEIDAILTSDLRKAEDELILDVVDSHNFYAITRKEDQELMDEINYAIEQLNKNEGDWKNILFYKYYGPKYSSYLTFTDRENKYISDVNSGNKQITVTSSGEISPYTFVQDGQLKGILPDYFSSLMQTIGLPYTLITPQNKAEYESLAHNKVDVVIDRIMEEIPKANTSFRGFNTAPYLSTATARVTRKDLNREIKTIAVPDINGKLPIETPIKSTAQIIHFSTPEAALKAVQDGRADAAYVYAYSAQQYLNHDPSNNLHYTLLNDKDTSFHMYVRDSTDHELLTILNKALKHMPDGLENHLISKYTSFTINDMDISEYLRAHPHTIIILMALLATIICIIIILYLRMRWNKELLNSTASSNRKLEAQLAIVDALSKDYTNVYSLNETDDALSIIKFDGYQVKDISPHKNIPPSYKQLINKYVTETIHPDDRKYMASAMDMKTVKDKLRNSDEYTGSFRILENGQVHHCQFTFVRVDSEDESKEPFILLGFRNIDEMIKREQEQKEVLAEALAQARYANSAKTTFLNNMSHDIRTPMNAIIGFTSLAVTNLDNTQQVRDYLGKILISGNHLLSLINDVLDMSRIESGKIKIDEKEASLPAILHDLQIIVQADINAKKLDFFMDASDVRNEKIICDKLRLNQVLLNILSNAIKYTKLKGAVNIHVSEQPSDEPHKSIFEFRISDTGIGMSKEFLKHVFEPFEREHTATVSGIQGTGLGLAITKNIVEDMMGGAITVESTLGKGSTFSVKVPLQFVPQEMTAPNFAGSHIDKVLLLAANPEASHTTAKLLGRLNISMNTVNNVDEAIRMAASCGSAGGDFDLFLLDYSLGEKTILEIIRNLRSDNGVARRIIILAPHDSPEKISEFLKAGAESVHPRPIILSDLIRVLADTPEQEADKDESPDFAEHFKGKKVLLVDDNEMNQEIGQMILEDAGFEVDIADDGTFALKLIQEQEAGTYDIILMDVQMPLMNGYEATRAIRELHDPLKARIPIIAMTANAFEEDRTEALDAGMNGYVPKPIDIKLLLQTLQEILLPA